VHVKDDDLVKSHQDGWQSKKLQMQGAQILRSEQLYSLSSNFLNRLPTGAVFHHGI
jgi:hypothetical protein